MKHLSQLKEVLKGFQEKVFQRFFEQAEMAQLDPVEKKAYEQSLKYYRDMNNVIAPAREEGGEIVRSELQDVINPERREKQEERRQKEEAQLREKEALLREENLLKMLKDMGVPDSEIKKHLDSL